MRPSIFVVLLSIALLLSFTKRSLSVQCTDAPASNVCRFTSGEQINAYGGVTCGLVNEQNDTSLLIINSTYTGYDPTCNDKLRQDGAACWEARAKLDCSIHCIPCSLRVLARPCFSVCSELLTACRYTIKYNPRCFGAGSKENLMDRLCAGEDSPVCNTREVDGNKLVEPSLDKNPTLI